MKKSNFGKFLLLWAGELISAIGGGLTSFGLGVYVFRQTGSAASMALVTLLGFLPTLLLSVPAGTLDYLVRTNIPDELQGRIWGFIGFLSQIGYVLAYASGGLLADLMGSILDTSVGRGAAVVIIFSGVSLIMTAVIMSRIKSIRQLSQ